MKFLAEVYVKAMIGVNIEADSLADATVKAETVVGNLSPFKAAYDYIDGETVVAAVRDTTSWGDMHS